MLVKSDTDIVKAWLEEAFEAGAGRGLTPLKLAEKCGVTPQAVNGWRKTGRITKKNLSLAAAYFGHGPSFDGNRGAITALQSYHGPGAGWPFTKVSAEELAALKPRQIQRLDNMLRERLDDWAEQGATIPSGLRLPA